jgi:hypothetical protein
MHAYIIINALIYSFLKKLIFILPLKKREQFLATLNKLIFLLNINLLLFSCVLFWDNF